MAQQMTKEQKADYERLCRERNDGRLLTPEVIRIICELYNYDAEAIGQHFLTLLPKISPQEIK